jgi:hypothetical protein
LLLIVVEEEFDLRNYRKEGLALMLVAVDGWRAHPSPQK